MPTPAKKPRPKPLTEKQLRAERAALGVPEGALRQRTWIRYQLHLKGWSQVKVAKATESSQTTVSNIYMGKRPAGPKADAVRKLTAKLLNIPVDILFPEAREEYERRAEEYLLQQDVRREQARIRKQRQRKRDRRARKQQAAEERAERVRARARRKEEATAIDAIDDVPEPIAVVEIEEAVFAPEREEIAPEAIHVPNDEGVE